MGAKNLIAELYEKELRRAAEKGRNVKRETLAKFVKEVMDNNNITGTKGIKNNAIKQWIKCKKLHCYSYQDHTSPLASIDQKLLATIIHMAQLCQSITPSQSVRLVNSLISGTKV